MKHRDLRLTLWGDPVLRRKTERVTDFGPDLKDLAERMYEIMYEAEGIGLAAPQAGVSLRFCVIDAPDSTDSKEAERHRLVVANGEILRKSGSLREVEGCLSIPGLREVTDRAAAVTVRGQHVDGTPFEMEAEGLLARVFQHEFDHTDGLLFIDRLPLVKRKLIEKKLKKIAETA
jgi:peptide deformylase